MFFPFTRIHTRRPIYALTGVDIETHEARAGLTETPSPDIAPEMKKAAENRL